MKPGIFCKLGESAKQFFVFLGHPYCTATHCAFSSQLCALVAFREVCSIVVRSCPSWTFTSHLAPAGPGHAALHTLDLSLELLDDRVALLEVLVETVSLRDELLLPLPEALLLHLDLLGEALAKSLFLFLELGVVQLARASLAELAGLHLACAVGFVVVLLGCVDKVKHVCANEDSPELLEVAVLLVLHLGDTPAVLTALDSPAVGSGYVALAADDGKGHGLDEGTCVLEASIIIFLKRGSVDLDVLSVNDGADLQIISNSAQEPEWRMYIPSA
jgi:hypothetical protein